MTPHRPGRRTGGRAAEGEAVVLIGGGLPAAAARPASDPLSVRTGESAAGVAIHGHILAGLLAQKRALKNSIPVRRDLLVGVVGVIGFLIGWSLWQSPWVGTLRWTAATGLLLVTDAVAYLWFNLQLPFTLALIGWFAAGVTAGSALHAAFRSRRGTSSGLIGLTRVADFG